MRKSTRTNKRMPPKRKATTAEVFLLRIALPFILAMMFTIVVLLALSI